MTLPPPNPDEVELRALLDNAVIALNALIIYSVVEGRQHLGYLMSDECRNRLVESDYLLNTVRDDVYHWWEELTPSPAV